MAKDQSHLKIGDKVKLTGRDWGPRKGMIVTVDYKDGLQSWSNVAGIGSLTKADGEAYPDDAYAVKKVTEKNASHPAPKEPTEEQLAAFKDAWEAADRLGLTGQRTRAGLIAVLNLESNS